MKQAYINGVAIPREAVQFELDRLIKYYVSHGMNRAALEKELPRLAEQAQEQAIGAKLLLMRAEELDLTVPAEMLDAQVDELKAQLGGEEAFKKALAARGIDEAALRKDISKGCRVNVLIEQTCRGTPEPSEEEVEAYFNAHSGDFTTGEQASARHILAKAATPSAMPAAREKISAIRARILAEETPAAREKADRKSVV